MKNLWFKMNSTRHTLHAIHYPLYTGLFFYFLFCAGTAYAQLDCKKCHKSMAAKKFVHTALQMGCEACHTEPHVKNSKFPKGLSAAAPDLCYGCHDKAKFTKKNIHPPVAGGMCSGCHDPHTSDNAKLLIAESFAHSINSAYKPKPSCNIAIKQESLDDKTAFQETALKYFSMPSKPQLPEEAIKYKVQAEFAIEQKRFEDAVEKYRSALNIAPWWPEGHFNQSLILSELACYDRKIDIDISIPLD